MFYRKQLLLGLLLLTAPVSVRAQVSPCYFINADVVYAAEYIPMLGFERFFTNRERWRSWHVDAMYQIHYNGHFGILFNRGDNVSIGVYQGPGVKLGYTYYTRWYNRKWKNYYSPTLGIKYLWYDKMDVNTGQNSSILSVAAWRSQSEKCVAAIPQFYIGQKRDSKYLCFDYYFGLQAPVKFRNKTIYSDDNNPGGKFPNLTHQVSGAVDLVVGVKVGYIRKKTTVTPEENTEQDSSDE